MRPWQEGLPEPSTVLYGGKGFPNPLKTLLVLFHPDTAVIITAGGLLYMIFCAMVASLSTTLKSVYNLNELEAG
jgi:hypothetical protein